MTTLNTTAPQPNTVIEKREASAYYKTLVRSGYAPVNGLQMYYEIHGTVSAKPLVTIHPAWGLANVFPQLSRNRQLIAVELQGHGRTTDIDRPLTYEQEADDVAALVKYHQIEQADFFGESIGGIVAVMMAVRHPELVRRVATYESALMKFRDVPALNASADVVRSRTPDDYSVQFQRENYQRVAPDPMGWPTLFDKVSRNTIEWKGFSRDELQSITAPVLIATGDHGFLGDLLEHMLEMARLIPNAQLAVIPDAGHFVLNDDPEKLLPIVATFLDQPISTVPFATPQTGYHPGVTR